MNSDKELHEAEQFGFLLKLTDSLTAQNNFSGNTDDQHILSPRAAALESVASKINTKNECPTLFRKDDNLVEAQLVNGTKRSKNDQVSPLGSRKYVKRRKNNNIAISDLKSSRTSVEEKSTGFIRTHSNDFNNERNIKSKFDLAREPYAKPPLESTTIIKNGVEKIIRNGSIRLSNLNSDKVVETMILNITFSSSEDDDSSSDSDL